MADRGRGATTTTTITTITTGRSAGTVALLHLWQPDRGCLFQRGV